ncbi:MAG: molybdopterin-synthase adenylyltransferase MoeB [Candidatus Poseidoniaceae archaeon]|nr:molybdopterin-synthase adenylyltransferase MoeB [Candidatus Poseidoniaceae archaeon]
MVDLSRHARHIALPQVGVKGQQKLADASVLVVGAGGLGSPALLYLAAAGIGKIGIIDDDVVDISNLQRQIIHDTDKVNESKSKSAMKSINALDPSIQVISIEDRLNPDNAIEILQQGWDVLIDGTDNIPTRYLIDDACSILGIPWIYGSIHRFEGQVTVFNNNDGPCYRDLFPEAPPVDAVPNCEEGGVLGVLPGVIGSIQATEAIKIILEIGESLSGRLLIYDAERMDFNILKYSKNVDREPIIDLKMVTEMFETNQWCRTPEVVIDIDKGQGVQKGKANPENIMYTEISMSEVLQKKENGWSPFILDVRSEMEYDQARLATVDLNIDHSIVQSIMNDLPTDRDILVHCKGGIRSEMAIMLLTQSGFDSSRLFNLSGGIMAWHAAKPDEIEY